MLHTWSLSWQLYDWPNTCSPISITDSIYIYIRLWPATNIKDARMSVCLVVWVYIDGRRLFMRSDFYYWLTTVVIVTVLFGLFIEFLWTTAKVPDIVCRIPDSGYYRISQILPDNPALPDIRYIPSTYQLNWPTKTFSK